MGERATKPAEPIMPVSYTHLDVYKRQTYDGYVAPSFLATPGAKEVGVEVFSLSKGYNMTCLLYTSRCV